MIIDCDECAARGPACGDCVVSVLLGGPPGERELGDTRWTGRLDIGSDGSGGSAEAVSVGLRASPVHDGPSGALELDATLRWAVGNLAAAGLVPPLRMLPIRGVENTQREEIVTPRRQSAV